MKAIHRAFRYKLAPTHDQAVVFRQHAGVIRLVYNLALEQRRDHWRAFYRTTGRHLNMPSQSREITALRAEYEWIRAVRYDCLTQALRDLDTAFGNFFAGRADFPKPRAKGINDSFRFKGRDLSTRQLNAKWSAVRLPKIGWIKFRDTRPIRGKIRNATVIFDALGWHVSFACEIEHEPPANGLPAIGIDRGVANSLSLSTGEHFSLPTSMASLDRQHRSAQRTLSRRKKGSKRRARALRRCSRLSARRARVRKDWHHKASLAIVRRFGTVVIEDLKIANMTTSARGTIEAPGQGVRQKSGLNRSILNQGWYAFETMLAYKLEERGGTLIKVNPAYTSQTCSECGVVDSQSRESQADFACRHCGFRAHADHNAAINILRRSTASMRVEEGRQPSGEARTKRRRKPAENHVEIAA